MNNNNKNYNLSGTFSVEQIVKFCILSHHCGKSQEHNTLTGCDIDSIYENKFKVKRTPQQAINIINSLKQHSIDTIKITENSYFLRLVIPSKNGQLRDRRKQKDNRIECVDIYVNDNDIFSEGSYFLHGYSITGLLRKTETFKKYKRFRKCLTYKCGK